VKSLDSRCGGLKGYGLGGLYGERVLPVIAPTGSGKTTFGIVASISTAINGGKTLIVAPTSTLAYQLFQRAEAYSKGKARIVAYNSLLTKKEKEEAIKELMIMIMTY